jgi:hypothetical protein
LEARSKAFLEIDRNFATCATRAPSVAVPTDAIVTDRPVNFSSQCGATRNRRPLRRAAPGGKFIAIAARFDSLPAKR